MATDHNFKLKNGLTINGSEVITSAGNLTNIGTISSGAITSSGAVQGIGIKHSNGIEVIDLNDNTYTILKNPEGANTLYMGDSGDRGNYYDNTHHNFRPFGGGTPWVRILSSGINVQSGGVQISGTTVIDSSRNLTNIGTISSGAITSTGNSTFSGVIGVGGTSTNSSYGVYLQNNKWYATQYSSTDDVVRMNANSSGSLDIYNQTANGFANVRVGSLNIGTMNVIDSSRNITAGTISSGVITTSSDITLNGGHDIHLVKTHSNNGVDLVYGQITFGDTTSGQYVNHARIESGGAYANNTDLRFHTSSNNNSPVRFQMTNIGEFKVGTTTILDQSRNLTNIGTISSGAITAPSIQASSGTFNIKRSNDGTNALQVLSTGEVLIGSNYLYVTAGAGSYFSNAVRFRGTISNDTGTNVTFGQAISVSGNIVVSGTVDGVDIAARNSVLTTTTNTANAALPLAGGTMTGTLTLPDTGFSIGNEYHKWKRAYSVSSTSPQEILYRDGNSLPTGGVYRFTAHIDGTGTDQSATAVFWNANGTWRVNVTGQSGTSSNHPEFIISSSTNKPTIHIDHTSAYGVQILHERIELSEGTGTDNAGFAFGTDAFLGSVNGSLYFTSNGTSNTGANPYDDGQRVFADNYHPNADVLTTARTIGGVSFNGSANINLPGVNTAGNQNTSGTSAGLSGTPNITVGTINSGAITSSGTVTATNIHSDGGNLIMGDQAYSTSATYIGMKTAFQSGVNDYMIISGLSDGETYVSAKNGSATNIRGGGNNSSNQIVVPDGSYISMETSNLRFNGNLQAGTTTVIDSARNVYAANGFVASNTWVNNNQPSANNAVFSGYGAIGNRATFYITNGGGSVEIGNGTVHNNNPTATFTTTALTLGANRVLQMSGQTVIDASRNITAGTISSGNITSGTIDSSGTSNFDSIQLTDVSGLGFGTVKAGAGVNHTASVDEGIFWHTSNDYGIYRTSGAWSSPFPVLKIAFATGVEIDGGTAGLYGDINFSNSNLKMGGTQFLDASRNLSNIGTISSGKITTSGTGTAGVPTLDIINTSSSTFNHSIEAMAPNLTANETNILVVGKASSTKNSGYIGYYYTGAGSNSNFVSIGHWGADHLLRVYGDGTVRASTGRFSSYGGGYDVSGTTVIDASRNLTNIGTISSGAITTPAVYLNNTSTSLTEGSGNALRIATTTGHIDIGSMNSGWVHIQANKNIYILPSSYVSIDGHLYPYSTAGNRDLGGTSNVWNHVHARGFYISSQQVIDDQRNLTNIETVQTTGDILINGSFTGDPWANAGARLRFCGGTQPQDYYIGTNFENVGGNYSKLDLRWHTGIRMGAQGVYGGIRFYNNEDLSSKLMSIGEGSGVTDVKVYNDLNVVSNIEINGTTVIDASRNITTPKINIGADFGASYPVSISTGQRYVMGFRNTGATNGSTHYPWFAHESNKFILHWNSIGDRFSIDHSGNVIASGNVTAYSDERLKENIQTLDGKKALQMRGVSFIKDGVEGSGVIAQELEKIAPELVHTNDDEMKTKSVAYGNLIGYLIETVKEQQKQIDELKQEVTSLSSKI